MRSLMVLIALAASYSVSLAQRPFQLNDYAWQAPIEASSATLQGIDLNLEILRGMSHRDAADIAVFDANGQALPTLLRRKPPVTSEQWQALAYQRFERSKAGQSATLTLDQQQYDEENGQLSRLGIRQQIRMQRQQPDYIIELDQEQVELGIDAIELDWSHEPAADFLKLDIQAANDIDHWSTIQRDKNLFKGPGRDGEWVTLSGLPSGYRYFRLRPHATVTRFELKGARGRYRVEQSSDDLALLEGLLQQEAKHPEYFAVSQPLRVNAKALRFELPSGFFLSGDLYFSLDDFDKKQLLRRDIEQHNIEGMDNGQRVNADFNAERRYWFKPRQQSMNEVGLRFYYPAREILFINNQQGPFTLAWGNHEVVRHDDQLSALVAQQDGLELADAVTTSIGKIEQAGGIQRQTPAAVRPWLSWALWLLLGLAVVITARMAWTLYRDMNR